MSGAAALLLAAFFGFVGYMKTFAPVAVLDQHHAWTTALPAWAGRVVGVSELACAAGLLGAIAIRGQLRWAPWIAGALVANQLVAAGIHVARGEVTALPQNAVLIAMLVLFAISVRFWRRRVG